MAMTVDKWSPYMTLQKEDLAKKAGVKKWEDIFLQPYEQAAQQVQTQAAYDISGAFSQYKQAQLSAMRNTQLGSGFKEQIASSLAGQYSTAFAKTKQQEASDIYGLQQQASETLASEEAKLQERAKMYAGLEAAILEQHGIDLERAQTSADAIWKSGEKDEDNIYGLGYFELQPDGSYKITERGIDFFDKALNKGLALTDKEGKKTGEYESFEKYLREIGDTELIDFYLQNFDTAKQFIGGLESGDMSWSPTVNLYGAKAGISSVPVSTQLHNQLKATRGPNKPFKDGDVVYYANSAYVYMRDPYTGKTDFYEINDIKRTEDSYEDGRYKMGYKVFDTEKQKYVDFTTNWYDDNIYKR